MRQKKKYVAPEIKCEDIDFYTPFLAGSTTAEGWEEDDITDNNPTIDAEGWEEDNDLLNSNPAKRSKWHSGE